MRRHLLSEFASPAIAQVLSDPRRPERVIADSSLYSHHDRPPANHPIHVCLGERIGGELTRFAASTAVSVKVVVA